jgi:hypothetical protein
MFKAKINFNQVRIAGLGVVFLFAQMAESRPWDAYNDPGRFGSGYDFSYERLPLTGSIDSSKMPWSESYWPRNQGSINYRWNAQPPVGFNYRSPSKEEVLHLPLEVLKTLSPAEKYDLYRGRYDYPLKNYIGRAEANPRAPDWAGICDGWTAAAIEFREPKAQVRLNPDGVAIPFGASDIKGLISYTAARQKLNSIVVGRYCPFGLSLQFRNCQDINPGTYHVILGNEIGLRKHPFPADVDPGKEAWNQPVIGYEFTPIGSARSENGAGAIRIRSKLIYVEELEASRWDPVTGTSDWVSSTQNSEYVLELDSEGRITGGVWITRFSHPDVFWRPTKGIEFTGEFANLPELYEPIDP